MTKGKFETITIVAAQFAMRIRSLQKSVALTASSRRRSDMEATKKDNLKRGIYNE